MLLSERSEHTGKFFGQIDGTIMDSLVQDRIYRRVGLMDYQGICSDRDNPYSAAGLRNIPVKPMAWLLQYIFSLTTAWLTFFPTPILSWPQHAKFQNYGNPEGDFDETVYDDYEGVDYNVAPEVEEPTTPEIEKITAAPAPPRLVSTSSGPRVVPDPSHARPCDLKTDLYLLQPDRLNSSGQNNPLKVIGEVFNGIQIFMNKLCNYYFREN